ncbi:cytochrome b561 domain-containing protein At4g18260 [Corylus avellana]|uniref:cytochrome b561 domain-containing protein At4g18260 n=1 Tax=Corylus avellana TaxID=13451 RepID=UPI001E23B8DA|nr:cytochrome b561 domain-containing protein At4g18260 [Corylus avellana]
MKNIHKLAPFSIPAYYVVLLPLVGCSSHDDVNQSSISFNKLSPQMTHDVTIHGILLWVSLGFLMPIGILIIRMSSREETGSMRVKVIFYLHAILQTFSVLLGTAGAIMSIKKFDNAFNNSHQILGLALYGAIWVQALVGFFRPKRGRKERSLWYFVHWMLGTVISLGVIINIYTGINVYIKKTSRSATLWTILFTAEVSVIAFLYLLQDKWEYLQKQGVILGNVPITLPNREIPESLNQKELFLEPCGKVNALQNLFD